MTQKASLVVSFIFWSIGTGLFLASMLTENWIVNDFTNQGLFKTCTTKLMAVCGTQGWNPDDVGISTFAPRILMLAAGALLAIGLIFCLIGPCCGKSGLVITEGVFELLGGLVVFAACGVYTGLNYNSLSLATGPVSLKIASFGFSFYLGWVSGLMFIFAGIATIIAGKR